MSPASVETSFRSRRAISASTKRTPPAGSAIVSDGKTRAAVRKPSSGDVIDLARSLELSVQEIARVLIEKITAANIEPGLQKCVSQLGDHHTVISMPLDDLRFAYGYLALGEAGAPISLDQTKRAIEIADKLILTH